MSLGRAVPWGSWEEWRATGHLLLSGVPADVQQGLERVAAWRARGRVPLGVDSTACLVEAQQRDAATSAAAAQQQQQAATASESELRLQYAMAVVRMVNGIADSSQRGRVAASVASLASAAGLPRILVDLRHEATHNELPSMAALRLAAQHALAWLRTNYWQRQSDHVAASKERIRAMVQEYLLLHQAAAAKVAASSAAGDSDDSDEEDGRPSAAAAAVAAAASVSAGRKSARSQGGGYGGAAAAPVAAGDAGPTTSGMSGGGGGGGYQAADAKKRRKQLLAELRSAVPKPAAALLAEAVLDAAAEAAAHAEGDTQSGTARAAAAPPPVAERALAAAMGHLCSLWPQLPQLLLAAAVRQLAGLARQAVEGGTASYAVSAAGADPAATATSAAAALAWVRRLLPAAQAASQQQQQQLAGGSAGPGSLLAVAGAWQPSGALLRQLLAALLPAQAAIAQHSALQSLQEGSVGGAGDSSTSGGVGALASMLQQASGLLVAAAKGVPGAAAEVDALSRSMALTSSPAATQPADVPGSQSAAQLAAAAQQQQALLQRLAEARQLPGAGSKRSAVGQQAAGAGDAAGCKRWWRADGWRPCAIGMVPSPADPNGELPPLDFASQLCLPASFLQLQQQQAAAAEAAAAARASRAAGEVRHEGLVQAERAQLAAAAAAAAAQAPWPAADRFSCAVMDTADAHEGAHEELPAAPPALLPASPAAFLL